MKKIYNIISISIFLFVSLLFLSTPKEASAVALPLEDISGGSGGSPLPPVQPPLEINFVSNLNKTSFTPGEAITLSGSIVRNACSNNVVNMFSEGYIVDTAQYQVLYNSNLNGGTTANFSKTYTAPTTEGTYTMRTKATTYSAAYFYVEIEGNYYARFTLDELITLLNSSFSYNPANKQFIQIDDNTKSYPLGEVATGTQALASSQRDLTFTVVIPPTVDVKVDTVNGPITKNTGDNVFVSWTSLNIPVGWICTCRCQDPFGNEIDCGSTPPYADRKSCGSGLNTASPITIVGVLRPTVFKVSCDLP